MTSPTQIPTQAQLRTPISVQIEFGKALQAFVDGPEATAFQYGLSFDLGQFAAQMGLEVDPQVAICHSAKERAVCIYLHDRLCPYPPELMRQAWLVVTPQRWEDYKRFSPGFRNGFPDAWVSDYAENPGDERLFWDFLRQLCLGVVKRQPAALLNDTIVARYIADDPTLTISYARPILTRLLEIGISLRKRDIILEVMKQGISASLSHELVAQQLVARLRKRQLEIRASPAYWRAIAPHVINQPINATSDELSGEVLETMRLFLDGYYYETGIYPTKFVLIPEQKVPDEHIVLVINDVDSVPFRCLPPDKILVNGTPDHLAAEGTIIAHPSNYRDSLIVNAKHRDDLMQLFGITTWTPVGFIVLVAYNALSFLGNWLLSVDDLEFMLAKLEEVFPHLIQATLARFTLSDIAHVLQELAREGLSIRDLPDILTQLLLYDSAQIDTGSYIVFDDRLTLSPRLPSKWLHHWRGYLAYTRNNMKTYISHKYTRGQMTLRVLLLSPQVERRLLATELGEAFEEVERDGNLARYEPFTDRELCGLRTSIWNEIFVDSEPSLCILTDTTVRATMRRVIEPEILHVPVVSFTELDPSLNIQPLARIESWDIC